MHVSHLFDTSGLESTQKSASTKDSDTLSNIPTMEHVDSYQAATSRLRKNPPNPSSTRKPSGQYLASAEPTLPNLGQLQQEDAARTQHGMPISPLPPPPMATSAFSGSRPATPTSGSGGSRPGTPTLLQVPGQSLTPTSTGQKEKKRHSWFGRSKKDKDEERGPPAWIAGHPQKAPYDLNGLLQAHPVQELWDDADGNCFVYLSPQNSGRGASFKIDSAILASSPILTKMAFGDIYGNQANGDRKQMPLEMRTQSMTLNGLNTPPASPHRAGTTSSSSSSDSRARMSNVSDPQQDSHLHLSLHLSGDDAPAQGKLNMDDLQKMVDYRNLFAFLCGQSLVATEKRSSFFQIFLTIASLLKGYEFSNLDASTYGETASASFDHYVEELSLADVRTSREKTIEGIVLGERMKSVLLYNEAFTHAVGKLDDLVSMKSPKFGLISNTTQNRLTRAAMDLEKREASVRLILEDFDFATIFTGIMASKMSEERKEGVRFDEWKDAFFNTRKWMIAVLKQRYGAWPPKASSKKNNLETSGLQRLVLRDLYNDLSSMYDLLVDKTQLTTRTVDGIDMSGAKEEPMIRALRAVLSEYDRSSPPVKPPVPFDLPLIPTLKTTRPDFGAGDAKKDSKATQKKLKDDEIAKIMRASWNDDAIITPFVDTFRDMERRAAHGCNISEIVELRFGQWIFMYAVLQALPMLACDAPGLKFTQGVEYFLCEPPRSGVPWADPEKAAATRRNWYAVGGAAGGVVSLPSDVVEHSTEGIYRRSHCWQMAEKWTASNPMMNEALHATTHSNGRNGAMPEPPPSFRHDSRSNSPASSRRSMLGMPLEALPLPSGVNPNGPSKLPKSSHNVDPGKTFDSILADVNKKGKKGKK